MCPPAVLSELCSALNSSPILCVPSFFLCGSACIKYLSKNSTALTCTVCHLAGLAPQGVVKASVSRQLTALSRYSVVSGEEGQLVIGNTGSLEELALGEQIGCGEWRPLLTEPICGDAPV